MFKRITALFIIAILVCTVVYFFVTGDREAKSQVSNNDEKKISKEAINIELKIKGKRFIADLEDNDTARAFIKNLPMTIKMKDLNSNEKYYDLPNSIPALDEPYSQIDAGDLMLYGDKTVVLFYESFKTSYSYTKIGKVQNIDGLKAVLGTGDVEVIFLVND